MIIQFCGLSGSGKTTLAYAVKSKLLLKNILVEVIDGDEYRKEICSDLGFSKEDRNTNIRRLAFLASRFSKLGILSIISAINPYDEIRQEVKQKYGSVKTVFIDCALDTLLLRDTKGLYRKALLPAGNPEKISNFSGLSDPFEKPSEPDLTIRTDTESIEVSTARLYDFILNNLPNY